MACIEDEDEDARCDDELSGVEFEAPATSNDTSGVVEEFDLEPRFGI